MNKVYKKFWKIIHLLENMCFIINYKKYNNTKITKLLIRFNKSYNWLKI